MRSGTTIRWKFNKLSAGHLHFIPIFLSLTFQQTHYLKCFPHCLLWTALITALFKPNTQQTSHESCIPDMVLVDVYLSYSIFLYIQTSQHPCLPFCLKSICAVPATICVCVLSDGVTGELKISNHSQSFAGIYLCEVNNAVGAESCRIILRANKRKGTQIEYLCPHTLHVTHTHTRGKDLDFILLSVLSL